MEAVTLNHLESQAPGGHGTDPNDSLVKQTYVTVDLTCLPIYHIL